MRLPNAAPTLLGSKIESGDTAFWDELRVASAAARSASDVVALSALRLRARRRGLAGAAGESRACRVALVGAYATYPLSELIDHFLATSQPAIAAELFLGQFDSYTSEVMEADGALTRFKPDVVVILPSVERCRFDGALTASPSDHRAHAAAAARDVLRLASLANQRTGARVVLGNFPLPPGTDPGPLRGRSLGTDWSYRKLVNLTIGEEAPGVVTIFDLEFLSARLGVDRAADDQGWFENKQLGSSELLTEAAREIARLVADPFRPPIKVIAVDLDNTLWGGVIGDDGIEGIVLGGVSSAGQAYKAFQRQLRALKSRGFLLAVASKNDMEQAVEPFTSHPDMQIRLDDIVAFKATWGPKPDSLRAIAQELNLGLNSFTFIDDSPAEIEHVRQALPEVHCILLDADPVKRLQQVRESDVLHVRTLTEESARRTEQYQLAARRQQLESSAASFDDYLRSLAMVAEVSPFTRADITRIAELTARCNQFNLTTIRRQESELVGILADPSALPFTIRLRDRFGDYGLISVVIGRIDGTELVVDTWLMSCRALKRQVEHEAFNELLRLGRRHELTRIRGVYRATAKNALVKHLYADLGFRCVVDEAERREFVVEVDGAQPFITQVTVQHTRQDVVAPPQALMQDRTSPAPRDGCEADPAVEAEVAAVWEEVLGVPPPDRAASLVALGADSLQMIRAHLLLCNRFPGTSLAVADLFRFPTVSAISARIGAQPAGSSPDSAKARPEPVYFGSEDRPLFGMLHRGCAPIRGAVLCCYPMPPKHERAFRLFHQLAGELAGRGYDVLRFDYSGTGDSSGEPSEVNLGRWTGEVEAAVDYLRSRSTSDRVSLVGMRIGAALAAAASRRIAGVDRLVLWEPAMSGDEYLAELRALNAYHPTGDRNGHGLDFHGFLLTPEFQRDLSAVSLVEQPPVASRILLIESRDVAASRTLEATVNSLRRETVPGIDWASVLRHDQIIAAPLHLQRIVQFLMER